MASRVECPFVPGKRLQKQGYWFILPQIVELETDSSICSKSDGLMDEEYDSKKHPTILDTFI